MNDIAVISSSYVQGSYQLSNKAYDRVRASLYFADRCAEYANQGNVKLARWMYRASLSDFKAVFDVLPADLREKNMDKLWKRSPFRDQLENNPLVKILKKARDFAIHTAKLPGNHKAVNVRFIDEDGERPKTIHCLFFDSLTRDMEQKEMKEISDDELAWFNRQAKKWPADLLIREAIYQSSKPIAGFLATKRKHIGITGE